MQAYVLLFRCPGKDPDGSDCKRPIAVVTLARSLTLTFSNRRYSEVRWSALGAVGADNSSKVSWS
jgi:hypothetical protein